MLIFTYMKIKFQGAAGTVTGSSYVLTSDSGESILIDYGMFQGVEDPSATLGASSRNFAPLQCDVSKLFGMVLTHAHLDHCGRIPRLLEQGFNQQIWMTAPTKDITEISLYDSAKINHNNHKKIIYTKIDVENVIKLFRIVSYEEKFSIGSFDITMRDAGHILGSASLEIIDKSAKGNFKKIVFSGDLGNSPQDLIKPTELITNADAVVMESTYGDKDHPEGNPSDSIQSEINIVEKEGGILLIPSFSIERSQEIMHIIYHLKKSGRIKNETTILFDSPMAEKVNKVFEKYSGLYNNEFKEDFTNNDPFEFPGLLSRSQEEIEPKVIIAGSGMMSGGKIVGYAAEYLPIKSTRLLIVGFQGEETLGRTLLSGKKLVDIEGERITVNATINDIRTMSSHAGQSQLMKWLKNINGVQKLFITHGEDEPRKILSVKIKNELNITDITLPKLNDECII
ncbi:MBL fold metallo-hydrolase [soil metagenome]